MKISKLLKIGILSILILSLTSCQSKISLTYFVSNNHQYCDTVTICVYLSEKNQSSIDKSCDKLTEKDSLLWFENILLDGENTFYAKNIELPPYKNNSDKYIYQVIKYRNEVVGSGSSGYPQKNEYTIVTLKNQGYAFDLNT
jgi:hypothetical protein